MNCPECGKLIDTRQLFCPYCESEIMPYENEFDWDEDWQNDDWDWDDDGDDWQ